MKILILASNPRKDLSLDREIRDLKEVIERSRSREQFEVIPELAVRVGDLQNLLLNHEPQIVHFCGHGGGEEGLVFENDSLREHWLQTDALSDLFRLCASHVECVLLNACYSEVQADAIVEHINYVIGMRQTILDTASIAFSKGFYRALGYDRPIAEAYEFGCNAIRLEITGSSQVRSAETEVQRKLEAVNREPAIEIPEHLKPILRRKPILKPVSVAASAIAPATQTEIQETAQSAPQKTLPASLSTYDAATWVGRDEVIATLTQKLREAYRILAITGMTGMGKTALAERVVVEVYTPEMPFHRLNFDDRGQGRDFLSGALALLPKLGETVTSEDQKDPQTALRHLLQTLQNNRFLVQIDSLEMLLQGDEQTGWTTFTDPLWVDFLQQLLAGETCESQLLLTSQALPEELEAVAARYPRSWHRQDLAGLSEAEQLQLFEQYGLKSDGVGANILKRFVDRYQGHPLVLQVIAKDILDKPFNGNVQQYWQRYQAEFNELERDRRQRGNSPRSLQLVVKQRVEQSLQRLPSDALQMLCRSSVYRRPVPEAFWLVMMEELHEDQQWAVLELLKSHNLAEQELRGDGLLLLRQHNLVKSVARELLKTDDAVWQEAERTAAQVWLNDYQSEPDTPNLEKLRGQLEAFHHYCEVEDWETAKEILIDKSVGAQLHIWGYFRERLPLYKRVLGRLNAMVDLVCERGIGNAYFYLSNHLQAIEHLQRSVEIARDIGNHQGEGYALGNLGTVYTALGNYSQAIEYHQQALTIARRIGDLDGEGYALGGLGSVHNFIGNYHKAIDYYQQRLIIARKTEDQLGESYALKGIGYAYFSLCNYSRSIEYHQKSLAIAHEIGDRPGEGRVLDNLGNAYQALGNYSKAIDCHQQSFSIAREFNDHWGEGCALLNWGRMLVKIKQYAEAQQCLQTSLEIFSTLKNKANEAEAFQRLAELHYKTGQLEQAQDYCDRALALATELGIPLVKECEALQTMLDANSF